MVRPRRLSRSGLCLAWLAGACSAPPAPIPVHRPHLHTTTITIAEDSLLPAATVQVPAMSTVVWRNRTGSPFAVEVDGAGCPDCETVLGFAPAADGGAARCNGAANGVATLCFHEAGEFPFVVRIDGRELRGAVVVTP